MAALLEVQELVKHFPGPKEPVRAVNGVSFTIREGSCFGLLGPNGAGKTTTVEMIEGITRPTSGHILYRGQPIGAEFKKRAGIQFQSTSLPDFLTVRDVLQLFSNLYPKALPIEELVKTCALGEFLDRDSHKLSGGQRQRLLLAVALVNDPDIVFLDEPTTGLDPQARRNFWDLVQKIRSQGKTVALTTHYMEEAYVLCDEIAIMDQGRIIAQGEPDHLLKKHFDQTLIELPTSEVDVTRAGLPPHKVRAAESVVEFQTQDVNRSLKELITAGISLAQVRVRSKTLEDLFLELTGRDLRA